MLYLRAPVGDKRFPAQGFCSDLIELYFRIRPEEMSGVEFQAGLDFLKLVTIEQSTTKLVTGYANNSSFLRFPFGAILY